MQMNRALAALLGVSILGFTPGSSDAHHSFSVNFNTAGSAEINGIVRDVRIRNPHSILEVDVRGENGTIERWVVETHAVPLLLRAGIDRNTFAEGEALTVRGMPSKISGRKLIFGVEFVKADGTAYVWAPDRLVPEGGLSAAAGTGLERFQGVWGYEADPNPHIFADSPLPLNQAALDLRAAFDPFDTSAMRCIPPNLPGILYVPYLYGIQIADGAVRLQHEYFSVTRTVPLDGGPTPTEPSAMFGEASVRFDGNAIVIESSGFPNLEAGMATAFDPNGVGADVPSSDQKRFTERYTVSDDGTTLIVDYTIEDPQYLTEAYEGRTEWSRLTDDTPIEPFECDPAIASQSSEQAGQ
jgi:hypothetical protein